MARNVLPPTEAAKLESKIAKAYRQNQVFMARRGDDGTVTPLAADHAVIRIIKKK